MRENKPSYLDTDYSQDPESTARSQYTDRYQELPSKRSEYQRGNSNNYDAPKYDNYRANNQNPQANQPRQPNSGYESKYERVENSGREERKNTERSKWDDRPLPALVNKQQQQQQQQQEPTTPKKNIAAIKYEEQFQKLQNNRNIHQSNILLVDPEPTDRTNTKKLSEHIKRENPQDTRADPNQKPNQKNISPNQVFQSTPGLLTWKEAPENKPKPKGKI